MRAVKELKESSKTDMQKPLNNSKITRKEVAKRSLSESPSAVATASCNLASNSKVQSTLKQRDISPEQGQVMLDKLEDLDIFELRDLLKDLNVGFSNTHSKIQLVCRYIQLGPLPE
eukprot:Awhi_evm1s7581